MHTPGPWTVIPDGLGTAFTLWPMNYEVIVSGARSDATSTPEELANINLMAKAPELAETLKGAIEIIEEVLPQAGGLVFQDYGKLNDVLIQSRRLLKGN